jgi:hypothetical protein
MRVALAVALFLVACGDSGGSSLPDAPGTGSNAAFEGEDPSPPDRQLSWIVVGLSTLLVLGSARARARDREPRRPEI